MLKGNCRKVLASGCKSYEGLNACRDCEDGQILETIEGITNCVPTPIENCLKSEIRKPFSCLVCNIDHYPKDGVCA